MDPPSTSSRRALLAGLGTGLTAALTGCSGSNTTQSSSDAGTLVTDSTAAVARSSSERAPIAVSPEDTGGAGSDDEPPKTPEPASTHIVEDENDAAKLVFAEDATNVAAVHRLVSETTYASESVFLYQRRVRECYRLQLDYVLREDDGDPDVQLCRVIRDAEIDCERDAQDYTAVAVRLPFPADEYDGFTVGSGGGCDSNPERFRNESEPA